MSPTLTDPEAWAQANFAGADLGDKRRETRLIRLATQIAVDSSASLPKATGNWDDLRAAYRLLDSSAVNFRAIAEPHWRSIRETSPEMALIL
ncbi:IS4/Tn5 family transposase DNA-binding protein, partial [Singulisphaera acidiphila]